jgi:hypothetical protein
MKITFALSGICLLILPFLTHSVRVSRTHPPADSAESSSWHPSPELTRALSMGYRAAASDFYWMDAVQYYGTPGNMALRMRGLAPILDISTDLDPSFDYPYQFAGQSVPYHDYETHLWYNTKAAIRLLRKGMAAGIQRWQVPWLFGYSLYTFEGAYTEAGEALLTASKRPRAPRYLGSLATRLLAQGDDVGNAIEITRAALAQAPDDRSRDELQGRLDSLRLQQQLDNIDRRLAARKTSGLAAKTDQDLIEAMSPDGLPADPFGGHFGIDPVTGKARSSSEAHLLRLHIHPGSPPIERTFD